MDRFKCLDGLVPIEWKRAFEDGWVIEYSTYCLCGSRFSWYKSRFQEGGKAYHCVAHTNVIVNHDGTVKMEELPLPKANDELSKK